MSGVGPLSRMSGGGASTPVATWKFGGVVFAHVLVDVGREPGGVMGAAFHFGDVGAARFRPVVKVALAGFEFDGDEARSFRVSEKAGVRCMIRSPVHAPVGNSDRARVGDR